MGCIIAMIKDKPIAPEVLAAFTLISVMPSLIILMDDDVGHMILPMIHRPRSFRGQLNLKGAVPREGDSIVVARDALQVWYWIGFFWVFRMQPVPGVVPEVSSPLEDLLGTGTRARVHDRRSQGHSKVVAEDKGHVGCEEDPLDRGVPGEKNGSSGSSCEIRRVS
ncbi:unnamed protein product [Darwinula stevensoni]|uniref:Uncharacterized protein n=1 Tax=Darwinula stevensoni TaxID=69355 RepID=A0A7R9A4V5_9CRUS|nr:unnamed protein product [Darwinula stevensoni]CAG0890755.1 unnamed protein product [Darwinula stevensoni]